MYVVSFTQIKYFFKEISKMQHRCQNSITPFKNEIISVLVYIYKIYIFPETEKSVKK